jgi:hypothetical protein
MQENINKRILKVKVILLVFLFLFVLKDRTRVSLIRVMCGLSWDSVCHWLSALHCGYGRLFHKS